MGTETITLYSGKKEALSALGVGRHIDSEYEIVSDNIDETGTRVIALKKKDLTDEIAQRTKLVQLMLEKLGETESRMFRKLLEDTVLDYEPRHVNQMIEAIESGKTVRRSPTHCFRLHIGDGRKKNSFMIAIRD